MKSPGLFVPICIINAQGWREKTKARLWAEERWLMQKTVSSCHESLKLSPLKGRRPGTFEAWAAQVRLKLSGALWKTLWSSLARINVLTLTSCKEKGKKFKKSISKTQTQYRHGRGVEGHSPAPFPVNPQDQSHGTWVHWSSRWHGLRGVHLASAASLRGTPLCVTVR